MGNFTPLRLLTIAGSDSGGGAGIQADLKTFHALGGYGMSAITVLTAQNTLAVKSIYPVSTVFIEDQLSSIFDDIGVDALKIGMLHSAPVIRVVAHCLQRYGAKKIVLDPVMVAKGGCSLLEPTAVQALRELLLPLTMLLTPNLPEAEILLQRKIVTRAEMERAANDLLECVENVVIKGGHLEDTSCSPDFFAARTGEREWIERPRVTTRNTHGTGCTYSAAITAFIGRGGTVWGAVTKARLYLQSAIVSGSKHVIGQGNGPVDHGVYQRELDRDQ